MFLTPEQKIEIQESIDRFYAKAVKLLKANPDRKRITASYNVRGQTGGEADIRNRVVKVNEQLAYENFEHYVFQVIGHEVAHIVTYQLCGFNIKMHGVEWKGIMRVLGLEPVRCHSYDTTRSRRGPARNYIYKCSCSRLIHRCSEKEHKLIALGASLTCRHCRTKVTLYAFESVNVCFLMKEKSDG